MDFSMLQGVDLSTIPSQPPPPGVSSNFVNPESNAQMTTVVISILLGLMIPFVAMRMYCQLVVVRNTGFSDYACVLATAASIAFTAIMYDTIRLGAFGRHMWDVPLSLNTPAAVRAWSVLIIMYGVAIFLAKMTVLLLYIELFAVHKTTIVLTGIAIFVVCAQFLANTIGNAILCVPRPGESWLMAAATDDCRVVAPLLGVALGAVSVFSDIFIIIIPLPIIWRLQLALRKKIGVSMIFVIGVLACLASILALVYRTRQWREQDNTWNSSYTLMLCVLEVNITIICSCMPSLAAILRHHLVSLRSFASSVRTKLIRFSARDRRSSDTNTDRSDERTPSEKMKLTLGTAVHRDGKFVQTTRVWEEAVADNNDTGERTTRGQMESV